MLSFRLYCEVTNPSADCYVNVFNHAWKTDGSEIGQYLRYEKNSTPGTWSAYLNGYWWNSSSYVLSYQVLNIPTIAFARVTPSVYSFNFTNPVATWKYSPISSGLPTTLALPSAMNCDYPEDVDIEITDQSTLYRRVTITGLTFSQNSPWTKLYLKETIGDGKAVAFRMNTGTSQRPNMVDAIGFNTAYSALWHTYHSKDYNGNASSYHYGMSGFRVDRSLPVGTYKLSDLLEAGTAQASYDGYIHASHSLNNYYTIQ